MKILAIESSATTASAAICEGEKLIAWQQQNSGQTHSRTLLPMVDFLLKNCDLTIGDMDLIAVAAGPGSFTGLRIGLSTAKGLAWPEKKLCCGVSTLESMAWNLPVEDRLIVCAMDARRNQIYNALFHWEEGVPVRQTPDRAISLEELAAELKENKKQKIIVGDGAVLCYNFLKDCGIQSELAPVHLRYQSAWGVAQAAMRAYNAGQAVEADQLRAVYLRLSQAERERLEREAKKTEGDKNHGN